MLMHRMTQNRLRVCVVLLCGVVQPAMSANSMTLKQTTIHSAHSRRQLIGSGAPGISRSRARCRSWPYSISALSPPAT
jgi:hypothetical protein